MLVVQPAVLSFASVQNKNDQGGFGNNVNIRMASVFDNLLNKRGTLVGKRVISQDGFSNKVDFRMTQL